MGGKIDQKYGLPSLDNLRDKRGGKIQQRLWG